MSIRRQILAFQPTRRERYLAWYGLWGGAVAWLLHFLGVYLAGEFGCEGAPAERFLAGITAVAWTVIALTAVCAAMGLSAAWASRRAGRHLRAHRPSSGSRTSALSFSARAGWIANLLFVLVILVQTIPVLFHLRDCGSLGR